MQILFDTLFWLSYGAIQFCIVSGLSLLVGLVAGVAAKLRRGTSSGSIGERTSYQWTKACLLVSIVIFFSALPAAALHLSTEIQGALVILCGLAFALHGLLFGFNFIADALIADRWAHVGRLLFLYYGLTFLIAVATLIFTLGHVELPAPE